MTWPTFDGRTAYDVLGVPATASWVEIQRAYRRLVLVHHPDRGGDSERMKQLNVAYALLKNHRAAYDASLAPRGMAGFTIVVNGAVFTNTNTATWSWTS